MHDGAIGDIVTSHVYWNSGGVWTRTCRESHGHDRNGIPDAQLVLLQLALRRSHHRAAYSQYRRVKLGQNRHVSRASTGHGWDGRSETAKNTARFSITILWNLSMKMAARMFSQCRHIKGCMNRVTESLSRAPMVCAPKPGVCSRRQADIRSGSMTIPMIRIRTRLSTTNCLLPFTAGEYKFADAENGAKEYDDVHSRTYGNVLGSGDHPGMMPLSLT